MHVVIRDNRFLVAARRWPYLIHATHACLSDQLDGAARHAAICALPRVEGRLLALFWQLADCRGVVRRDGIVIRTALTHERIGRMIAAKRPNISLALSALAADGLLRRDTADAWRLSHRSRAKLVPDDEHRLQSTG